VDEGGDDFSSREGGISRLQETTDRRNGRKTKRGGIRAELHPVKGTTKIVPRDKFSTKLWRQHSLVNLYLLLFQRQIGTANIRPDQVDCGMNIKKMFAEGVTEVFTPRENGQKIWPYTLSEPDLCKLAWAIHIGQKKILVPQWVKI